MNDSSISVRYSKALFSLAEDKNVGEAIHTDMENLLLLSTLLPEFKVVIDSPVISASDKQKFLTALLGTKVNELTLNFLSLLLTNSRETYLTMIARNFLATYRAKSGVKSAQLSSAIELDLKVVEEFRAMISKKYSAKVDINCHVDPSLLGGFTLQVDDQIMDASVSARLKAFRQELVKSK